MVVLELLANGASTRSAVAATHTAARFWKLIGEFACAQCDAQKLYYHWIYQAEDDVGL